MKIKRCLKPAGKALAIALACAFAVAGNSLVWAQSAPKPSSQVATELPTQTTKQKVIPDVWVMSGSYKNMPGWQPLVKPVLTTESFQQLRAIPCVASVAARRYDGQIALRRPDNKPQMTSVWIVDHAGLGARGWRLGSPAFSEGVYYLSPDLARALAISAKPSAGQSLERVPYMTEIRDAKGQPLNPPINKEVLIDTPRGEIRSLKLAYGGTFDADLKLLSRQPTQLALRFEPLFRSKDQNWTDVQLMDQQINNGTVVYVRTKHGLKGAAVENCRSQLAAHMQTWARGLPQTTWELVPLED